MKNPASWAGVLVVVVYAVLAMSFAQADEFMDAVDLFKGSKQSAAYFDDCYGYAVFPTIGKAGFGVGGAYGKGRVYEQRAYVGDTSMTQLSVGFQAGGQAYSQIVFFQDSRALGEFTSGSYEFGADIGEGRYHKGLAVFTIAKGGAMYAASVAGQKFSFKPVENKK